MAKWKDPLGRWVCCICSVWIFFFVFYINCVSSFEGKGDFGGNRRGINIDSMTNCTGCGPGGNEEKYLACNAPLYPFEFHPISVIKGSSLALEEYCKTYKEFKKCLDVNRLSCHKRHQSILRRAADAFCTEIYVGPDKCMDVISNEGFVKMCLARAGKITDFCQSETELLRCVLPSVNDECIFDSYVSFTEYHRALASIAMNETKGPVCDPAPKYYVETCQEIEEFETCARRITTTTRKRTCYVSSCSYRDWRPLCNDKSLTMRANVNRHMTCVFSDELTGAQSFKQCFDDAFDLNATRGIGYNVMTRKLIKFIDCADETIAQRCGEEPLMILRTLVRNPNGTFTPYDECDVFSENQMVNPWETNPTEIREPKTSLEIFKDCHAETDQGKKIKSNKSKGSTGNHAASHGFSPVNWSLLIILATLRYGSGMVWIFWDEARILLR